MPLTTTALPTVSHSAASSVTQWTLFISCGANTSSVALAAGIIADTMNTQHNTSSDQPAKKPSVRPNTIATHAYEVPALASARFMWMNANAMPNMIRPQASTLAGDSTPAVAMIVDVVISMLYAGAVPATPITTDSDRPKAPASSPAACGTACAASTMRSPAKRSMAAAFEVLATLNALTPPAPARSRCGPAFATRDC